MQCAGGFSEGIACFVYNSTSEKIPIERVSVVVSVSTAEGLSELKSSQLWIGGSAACDIIITISMVYFVSRLVALSCGLNHSPLTFTSYGVSGAA